MEKIYMDSFDKKERKQSRFKKFFNDKGSMTAMIIVAVVGVVGLMVFGLTQITYAIDPVGSDLGESFVTATGDETETKLTGTISGILGERDQEDGIAPILGYFTSNGVPVFCTEYGVDYRSGETYGRQGEINDYGLIYLLSQLYPNKSFKRGGEELPENVQIWLSQSAVWTYLAEINDPKNVEFKPLAAKVKMVDRLYNKPDSYVISGTNGQPLYTEFGITNLIETARSVRNKPLNALTVNKKSDNISMTKDNKYYQSDLISVVGSTTSSIVSSYDSYEVKLSNAPEGTILVDEKGNKYENISHMAPTAKFYVRVPVDKVTDANKKLEITINGNFQMYGAYEYYDEARNYQRVVDLSIVNTTLSKPLNIQLNYTPDVPDTGMGVAQTIYFIGLIVLLSGVGIVYANAKPETSK